MRRALAVLSCVVASSGCGSEAPSGAVAASASAAATSSAPAPPPPPPPPAAAVEDLDTAQLKKVLKCANDATSGPCGVLAKFSGCKPWSALVPSGDGRWIGRGHVVEGKKKSPQFTILRARRVPTAEVGPGQVPAKVGINEIEKSDGLAFDQADRAIRILERQDVPPRFNSALDYLKKRTEWSESYGVRTAGGQVYLLSQAGAFVCEGAKQQLLLVRRSATRGINADGLYAELWPTSW